MYVCMYSQIFYVKKNQASIQYPVVVGVSSGSDRISEIICKLGSGSESVVISYPDSNPGPGKVLFPNNKYKGVLVKCTD